MYTPLTRQARVHVTLVSSLNYVEVVPGVFAYRLQQGLEPGTAVASKFASLVSPGTVEGLTTAGAIAAFDADQAAKIADIDGLALVCDGFLESLQQWGFSRTFELMHQRGIDNPVSRTPYTCIVENGVSPDNLVRLDIGSHMVFDRNGTVLPTATYVDYIEAQFHNGCYDLEKAAEVLAKDPRVQFLGGYYHDSPLAEGESPIVSIPSYNAEAGRDKAIHFIFRPTAEDAIRLWQKQLSYNYQYPSTKKHEAMFDLDILGLRAAGVAKYDTFAGYHDQD